MLSDVDINIKEYPIGGKLIAAKVVVSDDIMKSHFSDDVSRQAMRQRLVEQLVDAMLQNKMVEITQIKNPSDFSTTIHARCYVAPDSTVKLLRTIDK